MIKFLSPTSISLFQQNVTEFYRKYVLKIREGGQTQPMAAGSAFDAFVKSDLYSRLVGKDARFEREAIFEAQVDPENRDWAWEAGQFIYNYYVKESCVQDLLVEMKDRIGEPRFEFRVEEIVDGVPLLGLPDIFFTSRIGARVIYDWKVNGFCAQRLTSPKKGFVRCRGYGGHKMHKDCHLLDYKGVQINAALYLEEVNKQWADQLSIYSWLMGEDVGSDWTVFGIDQVCGPREKLRFASHRLRISSDYQINFFKLIKQIWAQIQNDHYFLDLSVEDSRARCELLAAEDTSGFDYL